MVLFAGEDRTEVPLVVFSPVAGDQLAVAILVPVTESAAESPAQITPLLVAVTTGAGFTVMQVLLVVVHPFESVTVSVKQLVVLEQET